LPWARLDSPVDAPVRYAVEVNSALDALLSSVQSGEAAVQSMLAELAEGAGLYVPVGGIDPSLIPEGDRYKEQYGVIIICADEPEQQKVYEALAADGYRCRVVVT
jgi:hypothetical protein